MRPLAAGPTAADGRALRAHLTDLLARAARHLAQEVVAVVLPALDLTALVLRHVDLDAVAAALDVDAVVERVDLDAIMDRIDLDAVAARIDVEAIVARLDLDRIVTRVLAALIDGVVAAALTAAVFGAVVAGAFVVNPVAFRWPSELAAETTLVAIAVAVAYLTVGWAVAGRTVGGAVLGVRVVARDGSGLGWPRSAARALPCVLVPLGLLWVAVSARRRSLQDLLFRSTVVYDPRQAPARKAPAAR